MEDLDEIFAYFREFDRKIFNLTFEALIDIEHKENLIKKISEDNRVI